MTDHENSENDRLLRSLQGTTCPADGRVKKADQTFCGGCSYLLPEDQRKALYRRMGQGYAEAVDRAFDTLREKRRTDRRSIMDAYMPGDKPDGGAGRYAQEGGK